ncbi:hypothetical protein [Amycolatopsis sp. GA6-003]|uniref:hypothetical protein n=1 Tax=Amycolatopsis sp. GA6-003 TaxID=2652444 RepID=UPI003916EF00
MYTGDYFWKAETGVNGERACFGLTGCRMAWIHIQEHSDDVDGAKELAAFYCLDHVDDCHTEVYLNGAVNDAMEAGLLIGALGICGAGIRGQSKSLGELSELADTGNLNLAKKSFRAPAVLFLLVDNEALLRISRNPRN